MEQRGKNGRSIVLGKALSWLTAVDMMMILSNLIRLTVSSIYNLLKLKVTYLVKQCLSFSHKYSKTVFLRQQSQIVKIPIKSAVTVQWPMHAPAVKMSNSFTESLSGIAGNTLWGLLSVQFQ